MPLNALKGIFFEEEQKPQAPPPAEAEAEAPAQAATPATPSPATSVVPVQPAAVAVPGTINAEMAQMLDDAITANDLPGFDFLEFRDSLNNPAFATLPEQAKYQAVFGTASAGGLTVEKLLSSIDHYKGVIAQKKDEFQQHVEAQTAQEVTSREERKAANEQSVADAQQKIAELTESINQWQTENVQLATEISQETLKIQQTSSSFEATYSVVDTKLDEGKTKIQTYLGTAPAASEGDA